MTTPTTTTIPIAEPAPLFGFGAHCGHCRNTGYVLPDGRRDVAWPCPMCVHGRRKSIEAATNTHQPARYENGKDRRSTAMTPPHAPVNMRGEPAPTGPASHGFWHNVDHTAFTWNGGLTAWHRHRCSMTTCFEPVVERGTRCTSCVPDVDEARRVPRYRDIFASVVRHRGAARTQQQFLDDTYRLREDFRAMEDVERAAEAELAAAMDDEGDAAPAA